MLSVFIFDKETLFELFRFNAFVNEKSKNDAVLIYDDKQVI